MELIIISLLAVMVTSFVIGYLYNVNREQIITRERLVAYTVKEEKAYLPPELQLSFKTRVVSRVMGTLSGIFKRLIPKNEKDAYSAKLRTAGNPYGLNGDSYLVLKYVIVTISIIVGIFTRNMLYLLLFAAAGLLLPDLWLKSIVNRREDEVLKGLPNFLDLLSISVQAGLGFDAALQKVVEKNPGPLSSEFGKALQEMGMGKPRREAMKDMAERLNISEVTVFTTAIIQAELLGVSIGNVLQIQSQQARETRRMQAEEKAMKAPIKMLIPLVIFIFPVIFIILLGPAFISITETL
ncbi:type ii/iv secretion system protein tadc, associated with flp pilus assembly [hydrocarbon metagenome]|uniref:Type ii/iv secretion system protein tadc, associated with flp pilus assembly n=1 Tax=hydrocarbon metagenome TaxID=938273 RepID=A0A0W8E7T9_9ZZZZ